MERKNVIIIGTSRCGKSTIANKIIGEEVFEVNSTQSSFSIAKKEKYMLGKHYEVTVIDTASLNSRIFCKENVESYLKENGIEWINLIIFVIRAGRLTGVDKKLINSGLSTFSISTLKSTSALVISHCEQFNERKCDCIIQDFREDSHTKAIAQLMGRGIITTGIPSVEEYDDELFKTLESSIESDVAKVEDLIAKADYQVDLNYMFRHSYFEEILKHCAIL